MGLKDSGQIGGIKVHPFNTNTVWLAALGSPFGPNDERGIFKTTDGGKTWKKTLFVNNETGGRDIEVDWENPDILYAAMYKGFRKGWDIISGGPASEGGIYKSTDGGETWKHITNGLPKDLIGKIDIDIARSNPRVLYAMVEALGNQGGLYRSNDAGEIVDARQQQPARCARGRSTSTTSTSTRRTKTKCGSTSSACTSPPTAARPSRLGRDAARRQPRHVVQPRQPEHHPAGQRRRRQRQPQRRQAAGRRSSISRPPSTTWWRSTSSIRIASTCRSRTTAR